MIIFHLRLIRVRSNIAQTNCQTSMKSYMVINDPNSHIKFVKINLLGSTVADPGEGARAEGIPSLPNIFTRMYIFIQNTDLEVIQTTSKHYINFHVSDTM